MCYKRLLIATLVICRMMKVIEGGQEDEIKQGGRERGRGKGKGSEMERGEEEKRKREEEERRGREEK